MVLIGLEKIFKIALSPQNCPKMALDLINDLENSVEIIKKKSNKEIFVIFVTNFKKRLNPFVKTTQLAIINNVFF